MKVGDVIHVKEPESRNLFLFASRIKISIATRKKEKVVKVWRLQ